MKLQIEQFSLPAYKEIPDVGLYLEQVTKYINGCIGQWPGRLVTPSMLANYVKLKIVEKPVRKAYTRPQIARFLFIAIAKSVLSMEQIRKVLRQMERCGSEEEGYEMFAEDMHILVQENGLKKIPASDREETTMLWNVTIAIVHKLRLDLYFSEEE